MLSAGQGVGGERIGVVEPELGVGLGLDVRQKPGESRSSERTEDSIPKHSLLFVLSPPGTSPRFSSETRAMRACSGANTSEKRVKGQGPRAKGQGRHQRQRSKEAKRQRGNEAKRQRGKEAKRQRGREAKRQRGRERQRFACHFLDNNFHHLNIFHFRRWLSVVCTTQLPVMAVSARTTMKGAAKCDKHCELQEALNQ